MWVNVLAQLCEGEERSLSRREREEDVRGHGLQGVRSPCCLTEGDT